MKKNWKSTVMYKTTISNNLLKERGKKGASEKLASIIISLIKKL